MARLVAFRSRHVPVRALTTSASRCLPVEGKDRMHHVLRS